MFLKKLKLVNYKNYTAQTIICAEKLNCFVGKNGMGKTNLLDAVYYLCMCKSGFTSSDSIVTKHGEQFFRLEGIFELQAQKEAIVVKVQPRKRKEIERNKVVYQRLSEHIGLLPIVMIAPKDTLLATDGSEERRRFLDNMICQIDAIYLNHLIVYNKLLSQRNALLKQFAAQHYYDKTLLQSYDIQLQPSANYIYQKRKTITELLQPIFQNAYKKISNAQEKVHFVYQSKLNDAKFSDLLTQNIEKDRILQRTTAGTHKDDLSFYIDDFSLKKYASQGQLKSFVLALKLAQYELLKQEKMIPPILLLDDVFDKLDIGRVTQLLALLFQDDFGQVFITDTDEGRIEEIVKNFSGNYKKFIIEKGSVKSN